MSSAVELERDIDRTDVPYVVRGAVKIGLITAIAVLLYSLVSRFTNGVVESALKVFIIAAGTWLVTFLPGQWTRARTIEGIAGAAGIGLAGTVVYLLIDVTLLQNIGTYTNRWRAIGGGSNWWYHPVWWMVGTFLPWMGAFMIANQQATAIGLLAERSSTRLPVTRPQSFTSTWAMRSAWRCSSA